jgi:hypothetical protein
MRCGALRLVSGLEKVSGLTHKSTVVDGTQLHCIEYDNDNEVIRCVNLYNHPHELCHLAPSLHHPDLLFTCYNTGETPPPPPTYPTLLCPRRLLVSSSRPKPF